MPAVTPGGVAVRCATPDDAIACASVHYTSWVETYSGLLSVAHWETDTLERRIEKWSRRLDDGAVVTIAEVDGAVVGFAIGGAGRQIGDHSPVREHELQSLYVLADHHGTGAGQALLDAVVPPGPAQLWVAEKNPRARRFYERNGFLPDGERFFDERLGIAEVRLVR
nr:GNAT family N-acetyltransferase [Xylanimonas allomyrinae]